MGVFKEELYFLEELENRQERIYDDSVDRGVRFKNLTFDEISRLREVIKTLLELPGSKVEWRENVVGRKQRQYKLIIMWGYNDDNLYDATRINILYFKDEKEEYVSIDSSHTFTDKNGNQ